MVYRDEPEVTDILHLGFQKAFAELPLPTSLRKLSKRRALLGIGNRLKAASREQEYVISSLTTGDGCWETPPEFRRTHASESGCVAPHEGLLILGQSKKPQTKPTAAKPCPPRAPLHTESTETRAQGDLGVMRSALEDGAVV